MQMMGCTEKDSLFVGDQLFTDVWGAKRAGMHTILVKPEFRYALSEGIRSQVFFATFVQKVENQIKSTSVINALKHAFSQNMSHL